MDKNTIINRGLTTDEQTFLSDISAEAIYALKNLELLQLKRLAKNSIRRHVSFRDQRPLSVILLENFDNSQILH